MAKKKELETQVIEEKVNELVVLNPKQELLGKIYDAMIEKRDYIKPIYKLFPIEERILIWNLERGNINFDALKSIELYEEEQLEYDLAKEQFDLFDTCEQKRPYLLEMIDALCDKFVVFTGTLAKSGRASITAPLLMDLAEQYEEYKTIPKKVEELSFNFIKCMDECLKEISSRQQDPEQKARWEKEGNLNGEKWQKDPNQDPSTLYKADYMICKIKECGCK